VHRPPGGNIESGTTDLLPEADGSVHIVTSSFAPGPWDIGRRYGGQILYHGRYKPGAVIVKMRPLPRPIQRGYTSGSSLARDVDGSYVLVYSQFDVPEIGVFLARTKDFKTWSKPVRVPHGRGRAKLLIPRKDFYVLVRSGLGTTHKHKSWVRVQSSNDAGKTWTQPDLVGYANRSHSNLQPHVAMDRSGTFFVTLGQKNVVHVWSSKDLKLWSYEPVTRDVYKLKRPNAIVPLPTDFWQAADGRYHLIFKGEDRKFRVKSSSNAETWGPPIRLFPLMGGDRIRAHPNGRIWAIGRNRGDAWLRYHKAIPTVPHP